MRYFVVTHRPLEWSVPGFMEPVSTVPCGEGVDELSVRFPQYGGRGPQLSEYATLFALRRLLEQSGAPAEGEMIGVGHYRRFAVTRPIGTPSDAYGVVDSTAFTALPEDVFLPPEGTLLLPAAIRIGSVLGQYGRTHVLRDLLHFMGLAVDLGVLEEGSVAGLLSQGVMVAAPSVGVYPAAWYLEVLRALERVAEAFESTVAVPREGYQSRATAFCCERLHGMLLARLVAQWPGDRVLMNPAIIVSDDGTYQPLQEAS